MAVKVVAMVGLSTQRMKTPNFAFFSNLKGLCPAGSAFLFVLVNK